LTSFAKELTILEAARHQDGVKSASVYQSILATVGHTSHVHLRTHELHQASIYMKLEGQNPTDSIKDRTCIRLLKDALDSGVLRPGMTILDASSGNLGCALAYYARLLNYEAFVVSSSKLTAPKRDFIRFYGAKLHLTGNWTIEGNDYCRELAASDPEKFCFLDQLHNWGNPRAHYETTGPEILADFPELSMVVGSLGSGGSLLGVGQYIKEHAPHVMIVAVQAALGTRLPGTASLDEGDYVTPFIKKGYNDNIFDDTIKVTETDAVRRIFQLRDQGIFGGLQTGGVFHAALIAAQMHNTKGSIVVISGDSGWKNMDKLLGILPA
jgi:cysteine synthase